MYYLLKQLIILYFSIHFIHEFLMNLCVNSYKQLISVMAKCGVLFEVRTEFLNII
jgi:hypothetical protein